MEFSVRLKELRVDNDMSQTELAEKLNLKASAISKYEKGITQPSIDTLKIHTATHKLHRTKPIWLNISDNWPTKTKSELMKELKQWQMRDTA